MHISNSSINPFTRNKKGVRSTIRWNELAVFFLFGFQNTKSFKCHETSIDIVWHRKLYHCVNLQSGSCNTAIINSTAAICETSEI